jgi:ribosomal-protein-alanine N-acetyltransferase
MAEISWSGDPICNVASMDVPPIRSPRLELVSMSPAFLAALLGDRRGEAETMLGAALPDGWPDEHDARFLRMRLAEVRRDPELQQWLVRALVLREPGRSVIGHAGFHGAPGSNGPARDGALEVGYTIFEDYRGQGYATEAVVALMRWARGRGIGHFIASVAPDNEPSLAVVRKLGFVQTGDQWDDEDGLELVFELTG